MNATQVGGHVVVQGWVQDESPGTATITFDGAVSGEATPDSMGYFYYFEQSSAGGNVTAVAVDDEQLSSSEASTSIWAPSDAMPFMTMQVTYEGGNSVTLSGQVIDENPAGLTVNFSGGVSGSTTTDSTGWYSVTLSANGFPWVSASTYDAGNNMSNMPSAQLTSMAPVIESFSVIEEEDGWFLFSGRVVDESPEGLTVYFGGAPVSLCMQTAVTQADGWFYLRIQLNGQSSDNGTAWVYVIDAWGQQSAYAYCLVEQTGV